MIMNQFKRAKVIILPTDNKSNFKIVDNWLFTNLGKLETGGDYQHLHIISDDEIKKGDWILFSYKRDEGMIFKFIEKDKFGSSKLYNPITEKEEWFGDMFVYKKIIATTDTSLLNTINTPHISGEISKRMLDLFKLPQPSQQFIEKYIEEYNKGNIITEVMVEYEEEFFADSKGGFKTEWERDDYVSNIGASHSCWTKTQLKINPKDNTITIKKVKNSWNREEVEKLLALAWDESLAVNKHGKQNTFKQFKENVL